MKHPRASLPSANPTSSYWLNHEHQNLENKGLRAPLPQQTMTVIIGSGISGALIAHEILTREPHAQIVMLDARNVCNGATGRNGGHIKPDRYKSFAKYQRTYGTEMAKRLCDFEKQNMKDVVKFIKDEGHAEAVDLVETSAVDFFMDETAWEDAKESLELMDKAGGSMEGIQKLEKEEADKRYRTGPLFGAVSYPACSLWPRKLVLRMLDRAVSQGLQLFTHTPVLKVSASKADGHLWVVETTRGSIMCNNVFHATNGYVSSLLPEFAGKVVPVKANAAAIDPSPAFSSKPFEHTSGFQWGMDFDYMIQRPNDGMPLIIGGGDLAHPHSLPGVVGDSDDSKVTPEIQAALKMYPEKYFTGWGPDVNVRQSWTGIMGFSADEMPFVGEVPGRPRQFVVAGYSGHGMARSFLACKALVQLAFSETVDPRLPFQYLDIKGRLQENNDDWERLLTEAYACKPKKDLLSKL